MKGWLQLVVCALCSLVAMPCLGQKTGQIEWQTSFGGTGWDSLRDIKELPDGGYVLAGPSDSDTNGTKTSPHFGGNDYWIIRVDSQGHELWERSFGGSGDDLAYSIALTDDGGFLVGGASSGTGGNKTSPAYGGSDYWVLRLDATGNKVWEASFGGSADDILSSVRQTSDGGIMLGGWSSSPADGSKGSTNFGASDIWLVRLDEAGNETWETTFGGSFNETNVTVEITSDDGFIVGCVCHSGISGNKTAAGTGAWILKLDTDGALQWDRIVRYPWGWYSAPYSTTVRPVSNGDFLVGSVWFDDPCGGAPCPEIDLVLTRLDPAGNERWWSAPYWTGHYSAIDPNIASAQETGDGGVVAGFSREAINVIRLDSPWGVVWNQTFGGTLYDWSRLFSLEQTQDGGFVLGGGYAGQPGGNMMSFNYGASDFWILKLFPEQPRLQVVPRQDESEMLRCWLQTSYFGDYGIDRSTNLIDWELWTWKSFVGDPLVFSVPASGAPSTLYQRARRLP